MRVLSRHLLAFVTELFFFLYLHFDTLNNIFVNVNESPIYFNLVNHYSTVKLFWV